MSDSDAHERFHNDQNAYTPHNIHHNIGGVGATCYAAPQGGFGEPAAPASASDYVADMIQKLNTSGACPTGVGWVQVLANYYDR
jgi:hypothetical protein